MMSALIRSSLVNVASHATSMHSSELIMELVDNYITKENFVKSVTGKVALDLLPQNIEKVFHLPRDD